MNEVIKDLLADLITDDTLARVALRQLFLQSNGEWLSVRQLCSGLPKAEAIYNDWLNLGNEDIRATWLQHPKDPNETFLVIFYDDSEMECCPAIVKRHYFDQLLKT